MAQTPEPKEIEQSLQRTGQVLGAKMADQVAQGKGFTPDSRVGVLPEKVWNKHKNETGLNPDDYPVEEPKQ